jgi:predicted nucleic acid-binding protein
VKQVFNNLPDDAALRPLGAGERAAIALALSIHADLVLIGTFGILQRAARRGLLNLADAFERLKRTNFRYQQQIMDKLLNQTGRH